MGALRMQVAYCQGANDGAVQLRTRARFFDPVNAEAGSQYSG
jgi:hypothetical protein